MKTSEEKNVLMDTDTVEFEKKVQQLKNKYGSIYQIEIADQRIIFRPITRKEYKEAMGLEIEEANIRESAMARENLIAKKVIVYPEGKIVDSMIEKFAGIAEVVTDECLKVSGFLNDNERVVTKL